MKRNLSTKLHGKWHTFGSLDVNKWGNEQVSMRVSKELKNLINEKAEGEWLNFSLFEAKPKETSAKEYAAASGGELNDEIPDF